jgi:cephalosporin-C deacetylase-like acetyl esterase
VDFQQKKWQKILLVVAFTGFFTKRFFKFEILGFCFEGYISFEGKKSSLQF